MAAYGAVTSLMGTIYQLSQSNIDFLEGHKEHLKLLYEKFGSLKEFLDYSNDETMMDLQTKIKNLAHEVEDHVESLVILAMLRGGHVGTGTKERLLKILQQAIEDVDSVNKELIKQRKNKNLQAGNHSLGGSSSPQSHVSDLETDMVGYNTEQVLVRGQLTGHSSHQLEVISIAGMGGIGKSTFARKMFFDPSIMSFFDVRGWITVSKDYSLRKILVSLLQDAIGVKEELDKVSDGELADRLQKSLKGRRYLIVVDDIWSSEAWDDIRLCFPENNNRSRILLTTRDMKVAQYASSPKDPFQMRFLELEESWNMFCQKAFGKKVCPVEYAEVAKEVVKICKGLPLMISVVAGTLSSKRTLDDWRKVAESVSSLVNHDDYERCSGVIALSYNHLPSHLKACFLYFGVFPKAREISTKKLIKLWVAEGLLELKGLEGLEKVAANLLHDLIDKSLVGVSKRSLEGKIKTCRIHDLLHNLCLREAENNSLLYVVSPPISWRSLYVCLQGHRWVSFPPKHDYVSPISFNFLAHSKIRSIHFYSDKLELYSELEGGLFRFKLLRVLDLETMKFHLFPSEVVYLVSLRYLAVMVAKVPEDLPISNLRNLQTLIFPRYSPSARSAINLRNGIWDMSQLRYLQSRKLYLYSPPKVSSNGVKYRVLENLRSVSGLNPLCCTREIFEGFKKVKKLGISGTKNDFCSEPRRLDNLLYLHELEALNIASSTFFREDMLLRLPCVGSFPPNLNKLTLCRTNLPWEDMTIISKLPKLEVLQLKAHAFMGPVWEVPDMGFPELKFLLMQRIFLRFWRGTDDCFPSLERIIIRNCSSLVEIPQGFADSMTLQLIELDHCHPSLVNSAERIQEEQENMGNSMLKVHAYDIAPIGIKLNDTNNGLWSQVVEMYISGKDKLGYINGDLPQPLETDPSFRKWRTENAVVKGWMINSMDPNLIGNYIRFPTAKQCGILLLRRILMAVTPRRFMISRGK